MAMEGKENCFFRAGVTHRGEIIETEAIVGESFLQAQTKTWSDRFPIKDEIKAARIDNSIFKALSIVFRFGGRILPAHRRAVANRERREREVPSGFLNGRQASFPRPATKSLPEMGLSPARRPGPCNVCPPDGWQSGSFAPSARAGL